jgi:hypothetical protein
LDHWIKFLKTVGGSLAEVGGSSGSCLAKSLKTKGLRGAVFGGSLAEVAEVQK